jgi:3-methyl-2-oxobutanoate hydroxymethyltransferase
MAATAPQITVNTLREMKIKGEKFACLTAYDASLAHVVDAAGVEVILVGDSLGMVVQGHTSTLPVTMNDMVYHSACVARGHRRALLMADMPFMSYATAEQALHNAARLMQEGGAHMVKLEGGAVQVDIVRQLTARGIPVCAHLGLQPQSVHKLGGYRVQGRDASVAQKMREDAHALQEAGADILLLECVPTSLAEEITKAVDVPVIGIGAGAGCDAQVLVLYDMLGVTVGKRPKFSKDFMQGQSTLQAAIEAYVRAVKNGNFPAAEHTFS